MPCEANGLPTLQKISDNVAQMAHSNDVKFSKLEKDTKEMRASNDQKLQRLEDKFDNLDKALDDKIERKIAEAKEDLATSLENKLTRSLEEDISSKIDTQMKEAKENMVKTIEENVSEALDRKITAIVDEIVDKKLKEFSQNAKAENSDEIRDTIGKMLDEKLKAKDPQQSTSGANQVSPRTYMKNTVKNVTQEMREREKRIYNVILHGMPEPDGNSQDSRDKNDKQKITDILTGTLSIPVKPNDIKDNFRLGKWKEVQKNSRPLLMTVSTLDFKDTIFKNVHKLKGSKVTISYDLTPLEREEHKKMMEEAKELTKNDPEQAVYKVRGLPGSKRIVRLTKKEDVMPLLRMETGVVEQETPLKPTEK